MTDEALSLLLKRHFPDFPAVRRPGADQWLYAESVRSEAERRVVHAEAQLVEILDFGCGRGAVEIFDFQREGVRVSGTDVDPIGGTNPNLTEFRRFDGRVLPFEDGRFDIVCSAHVLEHVAEPDAVLSEIHRVLKPGGCFIAITPNKTSLPMLVSRLTPTSFHRFVNRKRGRAEIDTFPTCYRLNSEGALRRFALAAGFESVDIQHLDLRPEYFFFNRLSFYVGLAINRLLNAVGFLAKLRPTLFITMQRGGADWEVLVSPAGSPATSAPP